MAKHTTVALIQSIIALIAILANASFQSIGLSELNKAAKSNLDIEYAKRMLLTSVILQFAAAIMMITVSIVLIFNRQKLQQHMSKLIYFALIISGLLLLVGGSLGATVAVRLQCYRGDPHINKAWQQASISSVIGIVGTIVLLMIQAFTRKEELKGAAREYLTHQTVRVPTHKPVGPVQKAPMPAYHPAPYKKDLSVY